MNQIILLGRITKDLELRTSTNNKKYAYFTLVVNSYKEKVNYINCVVWEKVAENMTMYVGKGSQILINGELSTRKNNDNHNIIEVVCSNVTFIDRKKENIIDYEKPEINNITNEERQETEKWIPMSQEEIDKILT